MQAMTAMIGVSSKSKSLLRAARKGKQQHTCDLIEPDHSLI
jgi:hypothetical protein